MYVFAGIVEGCLEMKVDDDHFHYVIKVPLDERGLTALGRFCAEHKITACMCSSSIDFPEEDGAPEGFDAHEFLDSALKFAL